MCLNLEGLLETALKVMSAAANNIEGEQGLTPSEMTSATGAGGLRCSKLAACEPDARGVAAAGGQR